MALKTLVKVGKVSNLSDARYCAGMGVDMLGFCVAAGDANYVSPDSFKEIRGWFTGPLVVAEAYGVQSEAEFTEIFKNYHPDFVELSFAELQHYSAEYNPFILSISQQDWKAHEAEILKKKSQIAYVLIPETSDNKFIESLRNQFKVLVKISNQIVGDLINQVHGIALEGSNEEKPGLKNYDQLSEILEKLEVDDL